jgi:hypothetical protein
MSKIEKLTKNQLKEIKELAKTKTIKEVASHFEMSLNNFRELRKLQPEIDIIYSEVRSGKKFKIYTAEEIEEVEKLAQKFNLKCVAKHFDTLESFLAIARKNQPELDAALTRGMNHRASNGIKGKKVTIPSAIVTPVSKTDSLITQIPKTDSLFIKAPDDISPEEALNRFYRLKAEEKKKRQLRELKNMN